MIALGEYMLKLNFKIMGPLICIRPLKKGHTAGGIIIPEKFAPSEKKGVIIALGEGIRTTAGDLIPFGLTIGEIVLYRHGPNQEIDMGNEKLVFIQKENIVLVYTKKH